MTAPQPDPTAAHEPAPPTDQPDTAVTGPGPLPRPDLPLRPPQRADELGRLGPYRVLAVLGQGGMGAVFRAEDPSLRREVALKVMLPKHAASPASRARFVREARAQAAVEHDHVAVIHHVGEDAGVPFLAMPLLRGMSLADALRMNPHPPINEVVRIGREIADGLAAAHHCGLIHRDIKPGNVWLEGDRLRVKILDFGLARAATDDDDGPLASGDGHQVAHLTHTGGVVGTPAYMSPEQANGDPIDPRADLFSLGVVLYQMATGRRPFVGPTTADVLAAITTVVPPPASAVNPGVPLQLDRFIARLLAKDPAGRPASATAAVEELQRIELALTSVRVVPLDAVPRSGPDPFADLEPTAAETVAPVRVPRPSLNWKWPAVGAAAVVAAVCGVVLIGRPASPPTTRTDRPAVAFVPPAKPKGKPKPVMDADRKAAEALRAAYLVVSTSAGQQELKPGDPLPDEPFEIIKLEYRFSSLDGRDIYPAVYVADTLLPAVAELKQLTMISDTYCRLSMAADDLNRLAEYPSAANLTHLPAIEVTPAGMAAVRRFPKVKAVQVRAESLADSDLELLAAELPAGVTQLTLKNLGACGRVTDRGLAALARRPFVWLIFHSCPAVDAAAVRRLADIPTLTNLSLPGTPGIDAAVAEVAALPKLQSVSLVGSDLTGPGLMRLAAAGALNTVDVSRTRVKPAEVAAFAAARRDCRVRWDGGTIEPTAAPPVDLLATASVTKPPPGWLATANGLVSDEKPAPLLLSLAAPPAGDYEVTAVVTAVTAGDAFGILVPVGGTTAHCLMNGYPSGTSRRVGVRYPPVPGANANKTTVVHPAFAVGSRHTLAVEVRTSGDAVRLVVRMDGQEMMQWAGRAAEIPHPADLDTHGKDKIAATTYRTSYRIEAVTVRSLPPPAK